LSLPDLLRAAGHDPWLQATAIIAGTFILEDAATVGAALQVKAGLVPLPVALIALYLGIVIGDMGVYGLGRLAALFPWARRWRPAAAAMPEHNWVQSHVFRIVFISRFIPGARLPSYTACGFFAADFRRFALATGLATLIWTSALFTLSLRIGELLIDYLGAWRWAGMACFVAAIVVIGRVIARMHKDQT
jgi:membrane protein DedA with SNARE-associated domain